jgi:hypothetical protein
VFVIRALKKSIFIKIFIMKKIFFTLIALCIYLFSFSQARYTTTEYQKQVKPAVVTELPFPEKTISDAIEDKLGKMGYKGSSSKGFTVYKGVRLPELGNESYDLYFMVDRISRKDKGNSTVTLMISKGYETFVSDTSDSRLVDNAKTYLNNLRETTAAYDLELQITDQEDAVKKASKKYVNLVDEATDLQKKKRKLEDQIAQNLVDQKNQQDEEAKQKQMLDVLKGKRKQ